jgi:ketosteroid isomerase-like protein
MRQHSLPYVGSTAVRTAYDDVFKSIKLNIHFELDEVQALSERWAFARTQSHGTVKVLGKNVPESTEANQELFLLHKEQDGQWRFARYIFSSTNP